MAISFAYGSQSYFDDLATNGKILGDAVYFINDTQRIYRGEELIAQSSIVFTNSIPDMRTLVEDKIYVVSLDDGEGNKSVSMYVSDGTQLTPLSSQGESGGAEIDPVELMQKLSTFKSTDVDAGNWDQATDSSVATAGALRRALEWDLIDEAEPQAPSGE